MRLLSYSQDRGFTCTQFSPEDIPPYAILSHTWGEDELGFEDWIGDQNQCKAGYGKLVFCAEQARRDELEYFWIDTCCIDKRNSSEANEAINSMFRWYRNAKVCYVYLSDVFSSPIRSNAESSQHPWEADFRKSRWFTRGWTLQELLAPMSVVFYSSEHNRLGDKRSMALTIHDITGIPSSALYGFPLEIYSIEERMSWAKERQTTKDEDGAYCLLGIFGVFMLPIYGETRKRALRRLQMEIDNIPPRGIFLAPAASARVSLTI